MGDNNENLLNCNEPALSHDTLTVPGVSEFAPAQNVNQEPPAWKKSPSKDDFHYIQHLGTLPTSTLILEIKKLHDLAYQLGLEEAKEMTRGKYLNIFARRQQR